MIILKLSNVKGNHPWGGGMESNGHKISATTGKNFLAVGGGNLATIGDKRF
jgi:hypothetical protein